MTTTPMTETVQSTQFGTEILAGLRAMPKYLPSKYFYDKAGDRIFQEIMNCDEYYLFACELEIFRKRTKASGRRKVVLFLGSNLRNMSPAEARLFCRKLRCHLRPGDLALIGLDLKKCPDVILAAYNDKGGITKRFNLNLLERINRELNADFDIGQFEYFPVGGRRIFQAGAAIL